jgi:hypothetical protein
MNLRSQNALLSIGVDTAKAIELLQNGYNITKLQKLTEISLREIGLSNEIINVIHSKNRPPIPEQTIIKLLYESKMTCCICRDNSKSVIIHHIEEWSLSKDHSDGNLVVLCLQHHDEAHIKRDLSLTLSKLRLIEIKKKWLDTVKNQDVNRVFELYLQFNVMVEENNSISDLMKYNIINERGIPNPAELWALTTKPEWYMSDFGMGINYNYYLKSVIEFLIERIPLVDITNRLNVLSIKSLIRPGVFMTAQLGYYFSDIDAFEKSKRQLRKGYYKGNSISIQFVFDAWECTSSSGRFDALTGHRIAVPILFVKSVIEEKGLITINCSCLALGTWFDNHRDKDWAIVY